MTTTPIEEIERLNKENKMRFNVVKQTTREVTVKVDNGVTLIGTPLQVTRSLEALGFTNVNFGKIYNSNTKGKVLISSMATLHLANAVIKKIREWANGLHANDINDLVENQLDHLDVPFWDDEFKDLYTELSDRIE